VLEALAGIGARSTEPKFRIERRGDGWREKLYRAAPQRWALLEIRAGPLLRWAFVTVARAGAYASLPFFSLYLFGFLYVGILSRRTRARSAAP